MNPYYLTTTDMSYGFNSHDYSPDSASPSINPAHTGGHGAAAAVAANANSTGNSNSNNVAATASTNATAQAAPTAASTSGSTSNANSTSANPLSGPLVLPHQDLNEFLESFWTRQMEGVEGETPDFKTYNLPLARIKKVMKSDEEVKMISAEAPIMFSKACEIFISELTCRAWLVAEGHKRRTLQKSDVAAAIAFSDVFDFLIDIVPRDDGEPATADTEKEREWPAAAEEPAAAEAAPEEDYDRGEDLYSEYVREGEGY